MISLDDLKVLEEVKKERSNMRWRPQHRSGATRCSVTQFCASISQMTSMCFGENIDAKPHIYIEFNLVNLDTTVTCVRGLVIGTCNTLYGKDVAS